MEIILLERVENLGQMGDVVKVKNGFARNYLLPQHKALRATKSNIAHFENQRKEIEAHNLEKRKEAEQVAQKMDGARCKLIRQAGDSGQLYGSVSARDVMAALQDAGYGVEKGQVRLDRPIKTLGIHDVRVALHPEVYITVTVNVARSDEEAERQDAGEEEAVAEAEQFFESEELARQALEEIEDAEEVEETEEADASAEERDEVVDSGDEDEEKA